MPMTAFATPPFSIVAGGSYSVPVGTATAVKVRFTPTEKGPASGSVRFTGGAGETNTAEGTAFPILGWNFSAIAGFVTSPFGTNTGYILQNVTTTGNPTASGAGRAVYGFEITQAGNYVIAAWVNAVDTGADSVYINVDSEPTDPTMIWDVPLTSGFERRIASWRGNGSPGVAEFVPKVFNLSAGLHKLIVRGREPNARLDRFEITPEGGASRPATPEEFHILSSAP